MAARIQMSDDFVKRIKRVWLLGPRAKRNAVVRKCLICQEKIDPSHDGQRYCCEEHREVGRRIYWRLWRRRQESREAYKERRRNYQTDYRKRPGVKKRERLTEKARGAALELGWSTAEVLRAWKEPVGRASNARPPDLTPGEILGNVPRR